MYGRQLCFAPPTWCSGGEQTPAHNPTGTNSATPRPRMGPSQETDNFVNKPTAEVVLYTRVGCHLCDEADQLLQRHGLVPQLVDIDTDPQLLALYDCCVPMVVVDGKVRFRGRVNEVLLRRLLRQRTVDPQ